MMSQPTAAPSTLGMPGFILHSSISHCLGYLQEEGVSQSSTRSLFDQCHIFQAAFQQVFLCLLQ